MTLTLMVEFMGLDDHTPFWTDGFPYDPIESGIVLDDDLLGRGLAWEAVWLAHFSLRGHGRASQAIYWDSEVIEFEWACEGIAIFQAMRRRYPEYDVMVDLWPVEIPEKWEYAPWIDRTGVWTEAVGREGFTPGDLGEIRTAVISVLESRKRLNG